jgi:WD40 repeat protein
VIVWDVRKGEPVRRIKADDGVWALTFAPCGRVIAAAVQDGRTKVFDTDTGELLGSVGRHNGVVHSLRFDRTGKTFLTGGRDGDVRVWEVKDCTAK